MAYESPNYSGRLVDPKLIILHNTVSGNFENTKAWLCNKKSKASAHFLIGRAGELAELVPLTKCAWHAGKSKWSTLTSLNSCSIGIELVSWGPLLAHGAGYVSAVSGLSVDPRYVVKGAHPQGGKYLLWQDFTELQMARLYELLDDLMDQFPSILDIVGHYEVSAKMDPHPLDLDKIRERFGR